MAIQTPPWALENAGAVHVAHLARQAVSSALTAGVIGGGDYFTSANGTPNMTVNVAAGQAWVAGTLSAPQQSKYFVYNDAPISLAIAASDPTHARIDVACLTIQDSEYAGGTDTALLQIITGTPSASPVAPTLPANSLSLSRITVGAGVTSILTGNIANVGVLSASTVGIRGNPAARMYLNGNLVFLGSATWLRVFPGVDFAQGITTTSNQMTIVTPGTYRVTGIVSWANMVATGDATLAAIYVNGALARSAQAGATSSLTATPQVSSLLKLSAGDTVQLWMRQNSGGGGGQVVGTSADTWLEAELVSV